MNRQVQKTARILITAAVLGPAALAHSIDLTGPWRTQPGDRRHRPPPPARLS